MIDQAVNSFGMSEYDLLLSSSSPPRIPTYRRFNSQNEYERLFHEFSSVTNDELDACLSTNQDTNHHLNTNGNHPTKSGNDRSAFFLPIIELTRANSLVGDMNNAAK